MNSSNTPATAGCSPNSWVNQLQSEIFQERTCLIIGHSLEDINLKRILSLISQNQAPSKKRNYHYIILLNPFSNFDTDIDKLDLKNDSTSKILNFIMKYHEIKIKELESYGLKAIFVNDYKDIQNILKSLY